MHTDVSFLGISGSQKLCPKKQKEEPASFSRPWSQHWLSTCPQCLIGVTDPTQSQQAETQTNGKNVKKIMTIFNLPHNLRKVRK